MFYRIQEYKILFFRVFLAYLFYSLARVLFYFYNKNIIIIDSFSEFFNLFLIGLTFDTSAILYVNSLFILISLIPIKNNSRPIFQKGMFVLYFSTNITAYVTNYVDFIYYKFSQSRLTTTVFDLLENETNKLDLMSSFIVDYWHVFLIFIISVVLWIYLYNSITFKSNQSPKNFKYYGFSLFWSLIIIFISIVGMRGGLGNATRPINMVDAHRFVKKGIHADFVLNSPFCLIRTYKKNYFKKKNFLIDSEINSILNPRKKLNDSIYSKPNVVLIIMESFGREYIGAFNKNNEIKNYVSYTPFLDSLANKSLIFTNAFSNGRQSIEALPSILASLPSFKVPFTSSPYANQEIQSLVSVFNELDYSTSFFHGAPNGSMGFLGLSNILGFDNYFGKNEFNDNSLYDGYWGIWDEPFLGFMKDELDKFKEPFFSTFFSLTSHEPFKVPKEYKDVFPKGEVDMHQVIGYSDNALRTFFNSSKSEPWFKNTLFIITADHCNQFWYPFYREPINRFAIPIIFYHPNNSFRGENSELSQQLDIFPSIIDLVGYNKHINSWGRSLFSNKSDQPFSIHFSGTVYHFSMNEYNLVFDGEKVIGVYNVKDYALSNNIMSDVDYSIEERYLKAFYQDYMNRIIEGKLD
ncbi:MAG: LTA synthase family protein [Cryomorphaceae bacterium]|nr:MAG: LTA synthase family protein [Cryomorphaceae bacterium]|tara:strand:+ start:9614 stop:11518 length:1905 start_codon:yes stop_codon:yes gene_type:complete